MTPSQLREFNSALDQLRTHFDGSYEKAKAWLETPHPAIKDLAPIEMIRTGRGYKLLHFLKSELERKRS